MSIGIHVEFKDPAKESLYIPVATQGTYRNDWVPLAEQLGLVWIPEFLLGSGMSVQDLPEVIDEFRQVRALLSSNPPQFIGGPEDVEWLIERADMILEYLTPLDPAEIDWISIG